MDVDDTGLMAQLRGLSTSDNEAMVREFIQVIGEYKVTAEEAKFYLEMANWVLPDAIGAWYDNGQQNQQYQQYADLVANHQNGSLGMALLRDCNPDEVVPPNSFFIKKFLIMNSGEQEWPVGCELRFVDGTTMQHQDSIPLPQLAAGTEYEICVPIITPLETGSYQSQWRLYTPMDLSFGDSIFCIVNVDENADPSVMQKYEEYARQLEENSRNEAGYPTIFSIFGLQSGTSARPTTPNNDIEDNMME